MNMRALVALLVRRKLPFISVALVLGVIALQVASHRQDASAGLDSVEPILRTLTFGTKKEQSEARDALRRMDAVAVAALLALLSKTDENSAHRRVRTWLSYSAPPGRVRDFGRRYVQRPPDSTWRELAAIRALGEIGAPAAKALPILRRRAGVQDLYGIAAEAAVIRILREDIQPKIQGIENLAAPGWAAQARLVGELGPDAAAAVPALCHAVAVLDKERAGLAAMALGRIGCDADKVVPVLVNRLTEMNTFPSQFIIAIGEFETNARVAVPVLKQWLNDDSQDPESTSWAAALTIWRVLPADEASQFVPVSRIAKMCYFDGSFWFWKTYYTLRRTDPAAAAAILAGNQNKSK